MAEPAPSLQFPIFGLSASTLDPAVPRLRLRTTTHGRNMAGARSLWRATGMTDADFGKPIVAIANSVTQFVPGHVHLKDLGQLVAAEVAAAQPSPLVLLSSCCAHAVPQVSEHSRFNMCVEPKSRDRLRPMRWRPVRRCESAAAWKESRGNLACAEGDRKLPSTETFVVNAIRPSKAAPRPQRS